MKTQASPLEFSHFPVMLNEVIKLASPSNGEVILDCTFGGGGYSNALLRFPKTKVIGLDRDETTKLFANKLKKKFKQRFKFFHVKFSQIDQILDEEIDTIIFDLGVSSFQLKDLKRGFSFNSKDRLDMNMGLAGISAEDVVNSLSEGHLTTIIKTFGEENEASKIAKNIVKARMQKKITKADDLVKIIENSKKKNFSKKINPSTKTFQALRIFVNKEVTELINGIVKATKILKPGGKILIVSFHSIEDKIVKYFFSTFSRNRSKPSRYLPDNQNSNIVLFEDYDKKTIKPTKWEINKNKSSRSAKLRIATRGKNKFVFPEDLFQKFRKYLDLEAINV